MRIQLDKKETDLFEALGRSHDGLVLQGFIEKLIRTVESVRTKTDLSNDARIEISDLLEENFINRLKVIRGEIEAPQNNEYE